MLMHLHALELRQTGAGNAMDRLAGGIGDEVEVKVFH
jgi:hypothetical protein